MLCFTHLLILPFLGLALLAQSTDKGAKPPVPAPKAAVPSAPPVRSEPTPGATWTDPVAGVTFCWIPSGTFTMGSPTTEEGRFDGEGPQHQVTISKDFWLGKTEVTQAQWQAVMGSNPSYFKGADLPVDNVSWEDCQSFIGKLNARAGKDLYRLPTEAEWEYACRAGGSEARYGSLDSVAWYDGWYDGNSGRKTHPVGQKQANAWGLQDMLGNVEESCGDWYGSYASGALVDPTGPGSGSARVNRGGSWDTAARHTRAALRGHDRPSRRGARLGLRLQRAVR